METVKDFILGGSKIIADDDCSHEIKRHLLLGRKAMNNLDSILINRDLPTKIHLVKAVFLLLLLFFPVVIYARECWTLQKTEQGKNDAFELWCF